MPNDLACTASSGFLKLERLDLSKCEHRFCFGVASGITQQVALAHLGPRNARSSLNAFHQRNTRRHPIAVA